MERILERILDWIFPRRCIFCDGLMEEGLICEECGEKLPWLEEPLCRSHMGRVERLYAALYYDGTVPNAMAKFKFRGRSQLSRCLAALMLERMGTELRAEHCDRILGVPMHPSRQRRRGYNQAQLLARELSVQLDIPYSSCLKKIKRSKQQHTLRGRERKNAQKGSYRCQSLHGEKILLVDDICTSGETLKECARVLREAGAGCVIGAVVCKTPQYRDWKRENDKMLAFDPFNEFNEMINDNEMSV